MNWLTKQIVEFFQDVILDFIEFSQEAIVEIFKKGTNFSKESEIAGAINATTIIAVALISVLVLKQILTVYVFETDGDADSDPIQLLVKASQAICIVCCNDFIFEQLEKIASLLSKDMNAAVTPEKVFISVLHINSEVLTRMGVVNVVFILVYLIGFAILSVKAAIRGVELAIMKILLPIFSADILTVSGERWNAFFTSYVVTFLGYIVQMLIFNMSILKFVSGLTQKNIDYYYAAALLYFSLKTPQWLEKYAYSSGISKVARGGLSGAMQLAYLARLAR